MRVFRNGWTAIFLETLDSIDFGLKHNQAFKIFVLKINRNIFMKEENAVKYKKHLFLSKTKPLYIINKKIIGTVKGKKLQEFY